MKLVTRVELGHGYTMLDGDAAPLPQPEQPPNFQPICLLWLNGWMDQDATCTEVGLGRGVIVLDGNPAPLPKKGAEPPNFRPMSTVTKRLYGSRW